MSLYVCRRVRTGYRVVKFDYDVNVMAVYEIEARRGYYNCPCPASRTFTCRHREMVEIFEDAGAVDRGRFYEYETGQWRRPLRIGARA